MIVAGTENSDECAIDTGWWEPLAGKRIYIETYGCRYNFGDTANLVEVLKQKGSILVDTVNEADAVIINTCTVVGATERRMLRRLAHLQDKNLYVTGCMPMVQREAIFAICTPTISRRIRYGRHIAVWELLPVGVSGLFRLHRDALGDAAIALPELHADRL